MLEYGDGGLLAHVREGRLGEVERCSWWCLVSLDGEVVMVCQIGVSAVVVRLRSG